MNQTARPWYDIPRAHVSLCRAVSLLILLTNGLPAHAQNTSQPTSLPFSIRVTHLLGFEGTPKNARGALSFSGDVLQFEKSGKSAVQLKMNSIQDVFLGEQSNQIGGLPMTLGKAAAPYGGGRVISLFAHKKYDNLTLEYVDADGAFHGAIFQLGKGQGDVLRKELIARGVHVKSVEELTKQRTTEGPSEKE